MLKKEQKAKVRAAFEEIWHGDARMTDFCTNKVTALAVLPSGDFIPVEKQKIETRFCFGESGYDYDEAAGAAHVARTDEHYFLVENMKRFKEQILIIVDQYKMHHDDPGMPERVLLIVERPYGEETSQPMRDTKLCRPTDLIEATGPVFIRDLPGRSVVIRGVECHVPTIEELDAIWQAYTDAEREHFLKVKRYLKRYGLSKVHAWTYWRDA